MGASTEMGFGEWVLIWKWCLKQEWVWRGNRVRKPSTIPYYLSIYKQTHTHTREWTKEQKLSDSQHKTQHGNILPQIWWSLCLVQTGHHYRILDTGIFNLSRKSNSFNFQQNCIELQWLVNKGESCNMTTATELRTMTTTFSSTLIHTVLFTALTICWRFFTRL